MAPRTLREAVGNFFGFQIKREDPEKNLSTFAPKESDDGAIQIAAGGSYGTYIDLDGSIRSEAELISKYRQMAENAEIDAAIEDICNESIVTEDGEKTVEIILDDCDTLSAGAKKSITAEFEEILRLLEFNTRSYEVFRRYYVDGRLYYHVIIDENAVGEGIKELRYLDPRKMRKVKEVVKKRDPANPLIVIPKVVEEYYIYSEKPLSANKTVGGQPSAAATGIKIAKDSILYTTSGLVDEAGKMVLGHLHKAIKPLNQLRALEDATIIYRISRAPERRIFYIDVGNLPRAKAEQYMQDMITKHKNKLVYDSATGEIRDDRKFMTMLEDYWLPRREGGTGTQIETLPAGENLGELSDVKYFQRKLYKSLNVPVSRLEPEELYNVGRSSEISRDEVKFSKFIDRLRLKFTSLFITALERQLVLKGLVNPEEWNKIQSEIKFKFLQDNCFAELKDFEIMTGRLTLLEQITPWAGKYYSHENIRKTICRQTDEDIEENDKQIADEMNNPQFAPPIDDVNSGME
jgi:hypothetical protein